MTITPSGLPAWTRTADHTSYGGSTSKANYQGQGAVNPRTDVTAEDLCRLAADLAACVRTSAFCELRIVCQDSGTPADPEVSYCYGMAGEAPTATRLGDGAVRLEWPTAPADEYGVTAAVHVVGALGSVESSTVAGAVTSVPADGDADGYAERLDVYAWDGAAAAADAVIHLLVWTGVPA